MQTNKTVNIWGRQANGNAAQVDHIKIAIPLSPLDECLAASHPGIFVNLLSLFIELNYKKLT